MSEQIVASARPLNHLLRMAVIAGVESALQIHIQRGDDINARDANGMTPLMLSAARNKPAICKLLLNAGADHGLLDPSGRTALDIAIAAGSDASAEILKVARTPTTNLASSETALDEESAPAAMPSPLIGALAEQVQPTALVEAATPPDIEAEAESPVSPPQPIVAIDEINDGEFDLADWETEVEPTRPECDVLTLSSACAVQIAISAHQPIDSSVEWDDIDAYLPEVALPLARADDAEGRARLRQLLLRAIREGSIPILKVQDHSTNEDRSANLEAETYLTMVINDLGAEVDERFEYSDAYENFEVFIDPEETLEEESTLDEALDAIDRAASPRHTPLQIYQREFQRLDLLTAKEEVQIAKDMEVALDAALDALAVWPTGIERTLAAGAEAIAGTRQLSSIWTDVAEYDTEPATEASFDSAPPTAQQPKDSVDEGSESAEEPAAAANSSFADALRRLASLVEGKYALSASHEAIRQAVTDLNLNRRFLLELIDVADQSASCTRFKRAMTDFRKARDRMTSANLKLAFFLAKKHLYSGEPLDDLAQEGNIGLLKAVDRYDWRRGFRFSTYATWWIRQQISRYIADRIRTIRVPVHIHEKVQRMERMTKAFENAVGRKPTLNELATRMEMPSQRIEALQRIATEVSAIDELLIDDMVAIDARHIYSSPDPAEIVEGIQLTQAVDGLISSLSAKDCKDEKILRLRFGIGVDDTLTLDEIGTCFGVTRERIRQIESKAIRKLKHPARWEPFARFALGIGLEKNENTTVLKVRKPSHAKTDAADASPPLATREQSVASSPPSNAIQPVGIPKPSDLDSVLQQAVHLGIGVNDDRLGSGHIWVELPEIHDEPQRRLMHHLLDLGFSIWPGKGYWK